MDEGSREGPHYDQWGQIRGEVCRHGSSIALSLDALCQLTVGRGVVTQQQGSQSVIPVLLTREKKGGVLVYSILL